MIVVDDLCINETSWTRKARQLAGSSALESVSYLPDDFVVLHNGLSPCQVAMLDGCSNNLLNMYVVTLTSAPRVMSVPKVCLALHDNPAA